MIFKIPFSKFYVGSKSAIAEQRALSYGAWGNTYGSLSNYLRGNKVDFATLYSIYNNVVEVKMAIKKKQSAMAKEGLSFHSNNAEKTEVTDSEQIKKFYDVMEANYTFMSLKDLWLRDLDVAGNAYWHLEKTQSGEVIGVNPIDPRTMYVVADSHGTVLQYIQRMSGFSEITFDPDEIIHSIMDYSTRNPLLGVSPIESIVWEARTDMASQLASYFFYENNMVPSHLLILNEDINIKQAKDLKEKMKAEYGGVKNKFKAGIIPFVKDIKTISPSQKEMQFLENRKFNVKKIAVAFGVDTFLLGYTEGVQRANGAIIRREFYENTVRPYETYFEEILNNHILPALGMESIVAVVNPSDYDDENEVFNRSRSDVAAGIITPNEARQLRGMAPADNELADELMVNGLLLDDLAVDLGEVKKAARENIKKNQKGVYDLLSEPLI